MQLKCDKFRTRNGYFNRTPLLLSSTPSCELSQRGTHLDVLPSADVRSSGGVESKASAVGRGSSAGGSVDLVDRWGVGLGTSKEVAAVVLEVDAAETEASDGGAGGDGGAVRNGEGEVAVGGDVDLLTAGDFDVQVQLVGRLAEGGLVTGGAVGDFGGWAVG